MMIEGWHYNAEEDEWVTYSGDVCFHDDKGHIYVGNSDLLHLVRVPVVVLEALIQHSKEDGS